MELGTPALELEIQALPFTLNSRTQRSCQTPKLLTKSTVDLYLFFLLFLEDKKTLQKIVYPEMKQ